MKLRQQRKRTQRAMVGRRERAIRNALKKFSAALARCLTFKPRRWYDLAKPNSERTVIRTGLPTRYWEMVK